MAVVPSSRPFPPDFDLGPWEHARARFLDGLSPSEATLFRRTDFTVESLYYATDVSHKANLGFSTFCRKLQPLTTGLEDFGRAMDVYANAASLVLSPLWGSVRVLLALAQRMEKHQTALMDLLEHIGDLLPTYRDLSGAFKDEQLKNLLADAYLSILLVCADIKNALLKGSKANVTWKMFHRSILKSSEFDSHLVRLRRQKNAVIERATLTAMLETEKRAKADRNKRLLDLLSTIDYRSRHESLCAERHPGTCLWYLDSPAFRKWYNSETSGIFCCFGIPGCGKSVLSSAVVELVTESINGTSPYYCYLHCDNRNKNTLDPAKIFGCLCRQLLLYRDVPDHIALMIEKAYAEYRQPDITEIRAIFERLCDGLPQVFICIDGLDELVYASQVNLVRQTEALLAQDCRIKIHLSCREDPVLLTSLEPHSSIMLTRSSIAMDLKTYTFDAISRIITNKIWAARSPGLVAEISHMLVREAKDMFLWVRLQLDELDACDSEDEVRKVLADLPNDLSETYSRIITKVAESPRGASKLEVAARALQWIFCAQRPMTVDELEEAVTLDPGTKRLDMTKILRDDGMMIRKACGNLLTFNEQTRTLTIIHSSVEQYFKKWPEGRIEWRYHEAEELIAERCLTYLLLEDFESQIIPLEVGRQQLHAPTMHALVENSVQSTPLKLLRRMTKRFPAPSNQNIHVTFPKTTHDSRPLSEQYRLLDYVASFWTRHCADLNQSSTEPWNDFVNVSLDRTMAFEHRPWALEGQKQSKFFQWALEMGYPSFLYLIEWGPAEIDRAVQFACQTRKDTILSFVITQLGAKIHNKKLMLPQCVAVAALLPADVPKLAGPRAVAKFSKKHNLLEESVSLLAIYLTPSPDDNFFRPISALEDTMNIITHRSDDQDLANAAVGRLVDTIDRLSRGADGNTIKRLYLDHELTWSLCRMLLIYNRSCPLAKMMMKEAFLAYNKSYDHVDSAFMDHMLNDTDIVQSNLLPSILRCQELIHWPSFVAAAGGGGHPTELTSAMINCTAWYFLSIRYKLLGIAVEDWINLETFDPLYKICLLWGLGVKIQDGRIYWVDLLPTPPKSLGSLGSRTRVSFGTIDSVFEGSPSSLMEQSYGISIAQTTMRDSFILESTESNWETLVKLAMAPVPCAGAGNPLNLWAFFLLFMIRNEVSLLITANKGSELHLRLEEAWLEVIRVSSKYRAQVLTHILRVCWMAMGHTDDEFNLAQKCDRKINPMRYHAALPDERQLDPANMEHHAFLYSRLDAQRKTPGTTGHVFFEQLEAVASMEKAQTEALG